MTNFTKTLALLIGLFISSCAVRQENKNREKYITAVYYNDDFEYHDIESQQRLTDRLIHADTLYIFFENNFASDTVDIKIDGEKPRTLYLTTDQSIAVADMIKYGDINSIDRIEIVKNNGAPLIFEITDKSMNLWSVTFWNDTLAARRKKFLTPYM
jgi:hypothetical protein